MAPSTAGSQGNSRPPRPSQAGATIKIAFISAISSVITALITAGVTIYQTAAVAEKAAAEARVSADSAKRSEMVVTRAARIDAVLADSRCPTAVTKDAVPLLKTYSDNYEGEAGSFRELLNVQGQGCLVSGSILGYYVQNVAGGRNYTVSINLDGYEFIYPQIPDGKPVAYAQNSKRDNTGILLLPQLAFRNSLRITYYYAGGGAEIAAHALVAFRQE